MKKAGSDYEHQNYDEAIALLVPIIAHCPLTDEEKIQENNMLILSYIAIDNLEAANKVVADVVKQYPNYRPDKLKDDPKLVALYDKYIPVPVLAVGISAGINLPSVHVINTYSVVHADGSTGLAKYSNAIGFQFGINAQYKVFRSLWAEAGFTFRQTNYKHTLDSIEGETDNYSEKLSYFNFPISLKYYFLKKDIQPFLQAGADFSLLTNATSTISRAGDQNTTNVTSLRNAFMTGYFGAIGCNYKHNSFLYYIDISFIDFPGQVDKANTRYTDNINLWKYYYIDDDFSMNNMQLNIGTSYIIKYKNLNGKGK